MTTSPFTNLAARATPAKICMPGMWMALFHQSVCKEQMWRKTLSHGLPGLKRVLLLSARASAWLLINCVRSFSANSLRVLMSTW